MPSEHPQPSLQRKLIFGKSVQRVLKWLSSFKLQSPRQCRHDVIVQEIWEWLASDWQASQVRMEPANTLFSTHKISQIELPYLICIWSLFFHLFSLLPFFPLSRSISLSFFLLRITERMCGVGTAYIPELFVISSSVFMNHSRMHLQNAAAMNADQVIKKATTTKILWKKDSQDGASMQAAHSLSQWLLFRYCLDWAKFG